MDLPVGKNLQDHLSTYLGPFEIEDPSVSTANLDRDMSPSSFVEFGRHGSGVLTTTGVQASGIFSSSFAKGRGEGEWPDLQLFLLGTSVHRGFADALSHAFHLKRPEFNKYYSSSVGKTSFTQIVSLGRPKSRGEILLAKNDPYAPPIIDPKYLENEEDFQVLLEGRGSKGHSMRYSALNTLKKKITLLKNSGKHRTYVIFTMNNFQIDAKALSRKMAKI